MMYNFIYYMTSQISRADNQIQHADWPKIDPITSDTRLGSYWTDLSLKLAYSLLFY